MDETVDQEFQGQGVGDDDIVFEGDLEYNYDEEYVEEDYDEDIVLTPNARSATVLWSHVVKGKKASEGHGGTKKWKCKHCKKVYTGTDTRVDAHLVKAPRRQGQGIAYCSAVAKDKQLQEHIRSQVQRAENLPGRLPLKKSRLDMLGKSSSSGATSSSKVGESPLGKSFRAKDRDDVDHKVLRFLAANGIPFNVLRSPYFEEMIIAANCVPGYKLPSYEKARTTLLDHEKDNVTKDLGVVREKWPEHGLSIVSDGWTNVKNKALINVLASNMFGSMFLYAHDFSAVEKSGKNIAKFLLNAIEVVGPFNVVQVLTDNAANCKLAGTEVNKVYPHIFWSPCVVHILNLLFKDLTKHKHLGWIGETYHSCKDVVKYITNHSQALAIFRSNSKFELLKVAKTRFATHYTTLKRLLDVREALQMTVLTDAWKDWLNACTDKVMIERGEMTTTCVVSDEFWTNIKLALLITKPVYKMIKFTDQEGYLISEVYEGMDNMLGQIKDNLKDVPDMYNHIHGIVVGRWGKMNVRMHALAHVLTPKYYDPAYLNIPAPGGGKRVTPDKDPEIMDAVYEAIRDLSPDDEMSGMIRRQ
ncbi:uncharacterized protein LOC143861373 [Tasmannia lanceolata]|uniref:uncharacterized protein LOC143861373 n=1 Tax=Tasmannia lanceolata TaxID=3420 RepID=UPI004062B347